MYLNPSGAPLESLGSPGGGGVDDYSYYHYYYHYYYYYYYYCYYYYYYYYFDVTASQELHIPAKPAYFTRFLRSG